MNEVEIDVEKLDDMITQEVGAEYMPLTSDTIMGLDTALKDRFPNQSIFTSEEVLEMILVSKEQLLEMSQKWASLLSAEHQADTAVYTRKDITIIAIMMSLSTKGQGERDYTSFFEKLMKPGEPHMVPQTKSTGPIE